MNFFHFKYILGDTPEETMKDMGTIASPGIVGTEKNCRHFSRKTALCQILGRLVNSSLFFM